jgi:hypothetical protein
MVVVLFLIQGLDVFNTKTNQYSPTWDIKCFFGRKLSPGSVTAKVQLKATLPDLIVDKKVEKVITIEQEREPNKREVILIGTVNGDLTDRHSEMTITVDITLIEAVLL